MSGIERPASEPLLTPAETAERFRVDVKTPSRWAKKGRIHVLRTPGGHRRFFENEVNALLRGETWNPPPGVIPGPLDAPVDTLWPSGIPAPMRNRLQAAGAATIGELTALTAADLKHFGLRPPQIDEVRLVLYRKGLALHGETVSDAA